ncbi:hypothetical protein [Lishizhenia sp.]|uniref:hypothetical protein n=1 Tax=Lishizhenia sp. TaxID=2497594 RepID=UPI00299E58ED|nr:hypothetical protein [Lishizhenia sp.]MDX1446332.1 hypothetical protein [Lishizhenia sp.]
MQTKTLFKKSKTTFLKSVLIVVSSLVVTHSHSQVDIQIGTGTAISDVLPINTCSGYTYSQQIYTASEMNAGSIRGPYEISKIRFMLDAQSSYGSDNWKVFIGHTSKSSFSSNSDWETGANLTECFGDTQDEKALENLNIFLNPTSGNFTIEWGDYAEASVSIYTLTEAQVLES